MKAWFDEYENCEEEISFILVFLFAFLDVNYFEREMYIKELIFFILKNNNVIFLFLIDKFRIC